VEKYKHQLKSKFLKVEFNTKSLFVVYPELFSKLKYAYGEVWKLCDPVGLVRNKEVTKKDEHRVCVNLVLSGNYLKTKALFVSEDVKKRSEELLELMAKGLGKRKFYIEAEKEFKNFDKRIKSLFDDLEQQMKRELGAEFDE